MSYSYTAILIPVDEDEPISRVEIPSDGTALDRLQKLVGGLIEAVPWNDDPRVTTYVNEEGKFECEPNPRATSMMAGTGRLFDGDFIAGPYIILGFDKDTGEHRDCPDDLLVILAPRTVTVTVTLGNAAMQSYLDAAECLHGVADAIKNEGPGTGSGKDANGNRVVEWAFT